MVAFRKAQPDGARKEKAGEEMEGSIKKCMEKKGADRLFTKENLIVIVLVGILLLVIAIPTGEETGQENPAPAQAGSDVLQSVTAAAGSVELSYEEELEERLTDALSDMAQIGRVKVMITLKSSEELVVERETPVNRSATTETDAQGGNRTVNTTEMGESVVYSTDGSSSEPYVVKTYVPEIEGVLVVAEGAGSGTVNRTVTEIVQALFGVEAHKVKVVRMEQKTK